MDKAPLERSRLYFLLAWFHAVVQERLRYAPLGWTKMFEFNEADQRCALDTLDYWVDSQAQGKSNLAPEKIPWVALRTLLGQTVYGGRIDNEFDQRLLNSFLEQLFTEKSFNSEFPLIQHAKETLVIPEVTKKDTVIKWVDNLPAKETPAWLGLPDNAEILLLSNKGKEVMRKLLKLQIMEEEESSDASKGKEEDAADKRPAWMRSLSTSIEIWIKQLPESLKALEKTLENIKNPMFRFFDREVEIGKKLLSKIRRDLKDLTQICNGDLKQTNYTRSLIGSLTKGILPKEWKAYPIPASISTNVWIMDLSQRIRQLQSIGSSRDYGRGSIWFGGLFIPEAYITATRQAAAQANQWSLENLELQIEILEEKDSNPETSDSCFVVKGLTLEGAAWKNKSLSLTNDISQSLPLARFTWKLKSSEDTKGGKLALPAYLNDTRAEFLFSVDVDAPSDVPRTVWSQRSVALSCWKSSV